MNYTQEHKSIDFLVIGGGVAGLRAAIELARHGEVLVVTKDACRESSSEYAQGGVAVVLSDEDEISLHFEDTLKAGDGLCLHGAVAALVQEGPDRIRELIQWGAEFDKEGSNLAFTREAAHSKRRILHAQGDSTGREIVRVLIDKIRTEPNISKIDFAFTRNLIIQKGRCIGAVVCLQKEKKLLIISAGAVLLATGGAGHLYERTTNPLVATGDGMAMAYQAGAELMDMEFVQFHPTALYRENAPQFLLSEAMRGEGGILKNIHGLPFMSSYHPSRELAPRDVVTRAIHAELLKTKSNNVFLDMTHLDTSYLIQRFPRIHATCKELGIDITKEPIPVSPAAHYIMGGVRTDLWGRSTIPGLFAAGETACTGVHGANRLASNSLLEGLVFGERAAQAATRFTKKNPIKNNLASYQLPSERVQCKNGFKTDAIRTELKQLMWRNVGIIRNKKDLLTAQKQLRIWDRMIQGQPPLREVFELKNMITTALLVTRSALIREGSVGAHFRTDFPKKGKYWKKRTILAKK
ncbi:MAG: L-aspartate oxidase [Nitrospirota bacterium]